MDCPDIRAVAAVVEYIRAAEPIQKSLAGGSGFLFPSVLEGDGKGRLALTPAQITNNFQTPPVGGGRGGFAVHDALLPSGRGGEP